MLAFVIITAIFVCHAYAGPVEDVCPPRLVQEGTKYLKVHGGKCFKFFVRPECKRQYWEAQRECEKHKGNLAMPKTEEMNQFLVDALASFNVDEEIFIGLDDLEEEHVFKWKDGTRLIVANFYDNFGFGAGIFRDHWAKGKHCVSLDPDMNVWKDVECRRELWQMLRGFKARGLFVCEY
ncbi:collectin-10 [Plakobranchus ocellatus]|uniref:Collectin-10 n=1 Tax=Plakobranchus ocellatus TaxID=259542 RepID=A0AAV4B1E9_9GAST|nr:collectin-10 [Plakobranchus ocellatus]